MSRYFTAREIAAMKLPDMPFTEGGVQRMAKRYAWALRTGLWGKRLGRIRQGTQEMEYHASLLPSDWADAAYPCPPIRISQPQPVMDLEYIRKLAAGFGYELVPVVRGE